MQAVSISMMRGVIKVISRLNSGVKIGITFLRGRFFHLKKKWNWFNLIKLKWISKFWPNSLGNRFCKFCWIFEIYMVLGLFIWFYTNPRNFNPRNFQLLVSFSFKTIFAPSPTTPTSVSKDVEFSCASFDICQNFAASRPHTQTPTQKSKNEFSILLSQEIGSSLVSFEIIFEAL